MLFSTVTSIFAILLKRINVRWLCQVSNEVLWCRVKKCVRPFWSRCSKSWSFKFAHVQTQSSTYAQLALNRAETTVIITHSYSEFRQRKQTGTPQMCEHKTGEKPAARPSSDRPTELIGCLACTHPSMRAVGGGCKFILPNHISCQQRHQQVTHHHALRLQFPPTSPCSSPSVCWCIYINFCHIYVFNLCDFPCERHHRLLSALRENPLMNWRAPDKRSAVLFILSWLAGSFNGNLNKLLKGTMKLHLSIQCQGKDSPRIPVNSQIQPASLSFLVLLSSCSLSYRCEIDRRGCRALEIISDRPGSHLLCPPAWGHHPFPDLTALIGSSLPTEQPG